MYYTEILTLQERNYVITLYSPPWNAVLVVETTLGLLSPLQNDFKKRVIRKAIQKILSKPEVIPILQGR